MSDDQYTPDTIANLHPKYESVDEAFECDECFKCTAKIKHTWYVCVPCYGDPHTCYRCNGAGNNNWGKCFRCDGTGKITVEKAIKNACYDHHAMMREARKMMNG